VKIKVKYDYKFSDLATFNSSFSPFTSRYSELELVPGNKNGEVIIEAENFDEAENHVCWYLEYSKEYLDHYIIREFIQL